MAMIRTPKRVRVRTTVAKIVIATTQRISDHSHTPITWLEKLTLPVDVDDDRGIGVACV